MQMIEDVATVETALTAGLTELVPLQSDSGDNTLVFVLFFGIGLVLVYGGFKRWQQMRLIQDTPTEKVRSAAVGRTELSGTAAPIDGVGTIPQPFTGGEALVATYKIEEWEEDHDHDPDDHGRDGHWSTIDSGTMYKPFALDDGTGRMRVEPEADATYEISDEHRNRFLVQPGETPPDEVVEFFERQYDDDDDGLLGGLLGGGPGARDADKRRYSQQVIPPGEDVYLLGGAEPAGGGSGSNADRLVLRRDEGSEEFIISDKDEEELVSGYKWAAPALIVVGILLSAAMLYLLLA
jgi:hypothetical protein